MNISSLINKNLLSVNLKSRTKNDVLPEIVEQICKYRKVSKYKGEFLKLLFEREEKGTTGMGNGIAIPHARSENINEIFFFVGVSKEGINFDAVDDQPVHLIFLFITPFSESGTNLKILSKIASLAKNTAFVKKLVSAQTSDNLYHILMLEEVEKEGFLTLTKEEIYQELDTGDTGLADTEVSRRLEEYGPNKLKKLAKKSLLKRFLYNFTNLLAVLMWIGSGLAFLVEMKEVGWAIIAVIIINAIFSFWQEFKAEKAIEALKNLIPSYTRVMRNGEEKQVLSESIVPGDIIIIEEGDHISADGRLIDSQELRVDNSVFSGETKPTYKMAEPVEAEKNFLWTEIPNLIFAGTNVASGSGKAVIIATGMHTEIGKIAYLTQTVKEELSPLQKEINRLTKMITLIAIAMGFIFFFIGKLFTSMSLAGVAIFAIGMILANVPEGLLPTVTLSLAMAVQRMSKRNVLVKKLSSVETLGSTNVICTDKTGTITTNQMCVKKIWINGKVIEISGSGYEPKGNFYFQGKETPIEDFKNDNINLLMESSILCNTAKLLSPSESQNYWRILGDPTEGALLVMAKKAGYDIEKEREQLPYIKRFPFESVRKRMSSINKTCDTCLCAHIKGAPKEVLDISTKIILGSGIVDLTGEIRTKIIKQIDAFAKEGLRVLGIAYRNIAKPESEIATAQSVEKNLIFVGITAMYDPPRPEVKDALTTCKKAGIRVVMVTGDYQVTALSIATQVGIAASENAKVITGPELTDISDEQLREEIKSKDVVFARVNPEHKLRIVNAFKDLGNIVAVTGDGVNDAPALKRADIGVAMGMRGTDVAKEAAEMILTDDNFASIVAAIEEGRAVFENIKKFITYIFAHLVPEAVPFIFYVLFRVPAPITAMQILAIDLGTETLPALALGVERPEPGIMDVPPRSKKKGIIDKMVLFRGYIYLGLLNSIGVLAAYFYTLFKGGWNFGMQLEPNETTFTNPLHLKATTMVFVGIVVFQIANVFACRSEKYSIFKLGFLQNKLILWGIIFEMIFTAALIYTPFFQEMFNTTSLGIIDWGILFAFMIAIFFLEEIRKVIFHPKENGRI